MEDKNQNPITLECLANAYQQIQSQFDSAEQQVTGLYNKLAATRSELAVTLGNFLSAQSSSGLKPKKPDSFTGKSSVHSWINHVTNIIGNDQNPQAMTIAVSNLGERDTSGGSDTN